MGAITPVDSNFTPSFIFNTGSATLSTFGKLFYSNNPETVTTSDVGKSLCKATGLTGTVFVYTWHGTTFATKNCLLLKNESSSPVTITISKSSNTSVVNWQSDVEAWANVFNGAGGSSITLQGNEVKVLFPRSIPTGTGVSFGMIAEMTISGGSITMVDMIYSSTPTAIPTLEAGHVAGQKLYGVATGYKTTINQTLNIGQAVKFAGCAVASDESYNNTDLRTISGSALYGSYGQYVVFNLTIPNSGASKSVFIEIGSLGGRCYPIVQYNGITKNVLKSGYRPAGQYSDIISETIPTGGKTIQLITCVPSVSASPYVLGVRAA